MGLKITLVQGRHITAREKQVLAYAINNNIPNASSPRIHARDVKEIEDGLYSATLWHWETSAFGHRQKRTQSVTVRARQ